MIERELWQETQESNSMIICIISKDNERRREILEPGPYITLMSV